MRTFVEHRAMHPIHGCLVVLLLLLVSAGALAQENRDSSARDPSTFYYVRSVAGQMILLRQEFSPPDKPAMTRWSGAKAEINGDRLTPERWITLHEGPNSDTAIETSSTPIPLRGRSGLTDVMLSHSMSCGRLAWDLNPLIIGSEPRPLRDWRERLPRLRDPNNVLDLTLVPPPLPNFPILRGHGLDSRAIKLSNGRHARVFTSICATVKNDAIEILADTMGEYDTNGPAVIRVYAEGEAGGVRRGEFITTGENPRLAGDEDRGWALAVRTPLTIDHIIRRKITFLSTVSILTSADLDTWSEPMLVANGTGFKGYDVALINGTVWFIGISREWNPADREGFPLAPRPLPDPARLPATVLNPDDREGYRQALRLYSYADQVWTEHGLNVTQYPMMNNAPMRRDLDAAFARRLDQVEFVENHGELYVVFTHSYEQMTELPPIRRVADMLTGVTRRIEPAEPGPPLHMPIVPPPQPVTPPATMPPVPTPPPAR